jgi:hypothetical protein
MRDGLVSVEVRGGGAYHMCMQPKSPSSSASLRPIWSAYLLECKALHCKSGISTIIVPDWYTETRPTPPSPRRRHGNCLGLHTADAVITLEYVTMDGVLRNPEVQAALLHCNTLKAVGQLASLRRPC